MAAEATVHGAGLAGLTCALLLARDGCRVTLAGAPSGGGPPHLILNESTVAVLTRIWGEPGEGHALTTRRIRWGPNAAEEDMPAPALVVDGPRLLQSLRQRLRRAVAATMAEVPVVAGSPAADQGTWAIHATAPTDPAGAVGQRCALIGYAPLAGGAPPTVSRMVTTPQSWLYLAPVGDGRAMIQAMTPVPPRDPAGFLAAELDAARLGDWLAGPPDRVTVVPAAPWLADHRAEPGRIHIGGAVLRLDPVSGSGAGHALRTAILAAAVIGGIRDGMPAATALDHYTRRLGSAFLDHLAGCVSYYRAAFGTAGWAGELHATAAALTTHAARQRSGRFGLALHGGRLTPVT
jgi:flavin-dependent dehydrogenase